MLVNRTKSKESWCLALHPEGVCSFSWCFIWDPCFLCKQDRCWTCGCSSSGSYSCHLIQRTSVASCISIHVGGLCKHAKSMGFVHSLTFLPGGCSSHQVGNLFTYVFFYIFFSSFSPSTHVSSPTSHVCHWLSQCGVVTIFDHLPDCVGNHTVCISVLEASEICSLAYHKSLTITVLTTTRGTRTCFLDMFAKISKGLPLQCWTCLYHLHIGKEIALLSYGEIINRFNV